MRCPNCHATVVVDGGWTTWCESCGWNVDPNPPEPSPFRMVRWWQRRIDRAARSELDSLAAHPDGVPIGNPMRIAVLVMAIAIQVATLLVAAVAVGVWWTGLAPVLKFLISLILGLATIGAVAPRRRRKAKIDGWSRERAPSVYALLDAVAVAIGSRVPDRVRADGAVNASVNSERGETVLTIGLPLWLLLDDQGRIALLGHELGHFVNGDIRNSRLIAWSGRLATGWLRLFWPGATGQERAIRRRHYRQGRSGNGGLSEYVQHLLLLPFFGFALAVTSTYRALTTRAGHRAEYRADRLGALAGGTPGISRVLEVLWSADILTSSLRTAARNGQQDLFNSLPALLAAIPQHERDRLRRRAALRLQRIDDAHPPTAFRVEYVATTMPRSAAVADHALVAAADVELRRATSDVEHELRVRVGERDVRRVEDEAESAVPDHEST